MAEVRILKDKIPVQVWQWIQNEMQMQQCSNLAQTEASLSSTMTSLFSSMSSSSPSSKMSPATSVTTAASTMWSRDDLTTSCRTVPTIIQSSSTSSLSSSLTAVTSSPSKSQFHSQPNVQSIPPTVSFSQHSNLKTPVNPPQLSAATAASSSTSDDIDGAPEDSVVHVKCTQKTSIAHEALDESDIVRVFPIDDIGHTKKESPPRRNHSDIVRVFPEKGIVQCVSPESSIVQVLPTSKSSSSLRQSECVHEFDTTPKKSSASFGTSRNFPSTSESHVESILSTTPPTQLHDKNIYTPIVSVCEGESFTSHYSMTHGHSERRVNPPTPSRQPSPRLHDSIQTNLRNQRMVEAQRNFGMIRQVPCPSASIRESPELPTPPETPVEADDDDDEVFSYDSLCEDALSKRRAVDLHRQAIESTPRQDRNQSRHNSDRSSELRRQSAHRSSPFSPAHGMAELSFGDRQHTRKRLSFEEEEEGISHQPRPHPQYHSDPSSLNLMNLAPPPPPRSHCVQASNNNYVSPIATNPIFCNAPNKLSNSSSVYRSQTPPTFSSNSRQVPSDPSPKNYLPVPMSHPMTPSDSKIHDHSINPGYPVNSQSPVREVMNMLERVSKENAAITARSRLHSDGDEALTGHAQWVTPTDRGSPIAEEFRPRRQTYSYGKRRRLDAEFQEHDNKECSANQRSATSQRDQANRSYGNCSCAKIEQNVLQMAENAYKRVRMDGANTDFGQFCQDVQQANDIIRQSLDLMKKIKSICGHETQASLPSTSSTSLSSSSFFLPSTSSPSN